MKTTASGETLSASAQILSLLSDGEWHSNDELYAISRRPSAIIFTLKERGLPLEKKKDENVRFKEYWRVVDKVPAELTIVGWKIRNQNQRATLARFNGQDHKIRATVIH